MDTHPLCFIPVPKFASFKTNPAFSGTRTRGMNSILLKDYGAGIGTSWHQDNSSHLNPSNILKPCTIKGRTHIFSNINNTKNTKQLDYLQIEKFSNRVISESYCRELWWSRKGLEKLHGKYKFRSDGKHLRESPS